MASSALLISLALAWRAPAVPPDPVPATHPRVPLTREFNRALGREEKERSVASTVALLGDLVKTAMEADFERAVDDPSACRASIEIGYTLLVNRQPVLTGGIGGRREVAHLRSIRGIGLVPAPSPPEAPPGLDLAEQPAVVSGRLVAAG